MKPICLILLALAGDFLFASSALAADVVFNEGTELELTGLATTLYALSGSKADTVTVDGSTLTVDIPAASSFTLGAGSPIHNVLKVTPSGGTTTLTFEAGNLSSAGYASQWKLDSSTATSWEILVGNPQADTGYQVKINSVHYRFFNSGNSGEFTFTYTDSFSNQTFSVARSPGGGTPPSGTDLPPTPPLSVTGEALPFQVLVNPDASGHSASKTASPEVSLELVTGPNTVQYTITNTDSFSDSLLTPYPANGKISWDLCSHLLPDDCVPGDYTVSVKFYTAYGVSTDPITATITYDPDAGGTFPAEDSDEITRLKARIRELQLIVIDLATQLVEVLQERITGEYTRRLEKG